MAEKNTLVNYQRYPRKFFSGSDAYIFFNNVFVDQVLSIEFDMVQNVNPIYGYASYVADAVAYGSRIITGRFRINYTENMYLYTIMGLVGYDKYNGDTAEKALSQKLMVDSGLTSEHIAEMIKNGKMEKLITVMDSCEERIWGTHKNTPTIDKKKSPYFTSNISSSVKTEGFDIIISYGDKEFDVASSPNEIPSTVRTINGVFLTGVRQGIAPSGEPLYEEYTFIGKDMNNTIKPKR